MRLAVSLGLLAGLFASTLGASLSDELSAIEKMLDTLEHKEEKAKTAKKNDEKEPKPCDKKPNVLFIIADDLGWNDVGYANSQVRSPHIDELARNGVILDNNYVQSVCTPSRHTIMTGRYPYRSKMQHMVLSEDTPHCTPTNLKFLPERFKDAGYNTYAVGKWHLGFCQWECTPTFRGFDHFYGCYAGAEDYYTHRAGTLEGYDWRRETETDWTVNGKYHTDIVREYVTDAIYEYDSDKPFFMYLSFTNVHTPLQVPEKYYNMFPDCMDEGRRTYLGMMYAMDEAIGQIVNSLKRRGLFENTLIVFTADNGGEQGGNADNFPLRGGKSSLWEGGSRVRGWVHGEMLKKSGYTHTGLFHEADWTPTLMSIVEGEQPEAGTIDGMDQSDMIMNGGPSVRDHIIYNIDMQPGPTFGQAAVRVGDWKLVWGQEGYIDGWGRNDLHYFFEDPRNLALLGMTKAEVRETARAHLTQRARTSGLGSHAKNYVSFTSEEIQIMQQLFAIKCFTADDINSGSVHLFNIVDDPTEHNDLAGDAANQDKILELKNFILDLLVDYVAPPAVAGGHWVEQSQPSNFNDTWTPGWCNDLDMTVPSNMIGLTGGR